VRLKAINLTFFIWAHPLSSFFWRSLQTTPKKTRKGSGYPLLCGYATPISLRHTCLPLRGQPAST